ncbi:MAG TPA: hypothetical protein VGR95_05885 [Thermoanaerobaculia bacterium]|nr:hypothetical protein [Thermoanaerobaculia bacterium]
MATARHRVFGGLNERQELIFHWIGVVVVLLYVTAWIGALHNVYDIHRQAIAEAKVTHVPPPPAPAAPTQQITAALTGNAPSTAYITDAMLGFLNPLRGASGKVLFTTRIPGAPITDTHGNLTAVLNNGQATDISPEFVAPSQPGVYDLAVKLGQATKQINDFSVISLVPFSEKQSGHIGLYYLGTWPFEKGGKMKSAAYANPAGFIKVTPENADTPVSAHFKLRDFLTKDQYNVWPKYILLNPKLLDKLELTIAELERTGHPVRNMHIMSGFRSPEYNYTGGNTQGRANLSRHMYGDASDVFIDNDGNGAEDDLNHDGRLDIRDAMVVQQAVDRVEHDHPELVGGVGVYPACCGHGPFTHIDVRGYRARWRGTTGG